MFVLVTGGARSGKSAIARARLAAIARPPFVFVATCRPLDDEMRARVGRHQSERGPEWRTLEAPRELGAALERPEPALVDCVTLWLSQRLLDGESDEQILAAVEEVASLARARTPPLVVVTNEVGAGVVPDHPLGRRFRDLQGFANQRLASVADEVLLVACGLPLRLK